VAYDDSPEAAHALEVAAALASTAGAALRLIEVVEPQPSPIVGPTTIYAGLQGEESYREAIRHHLDEVAAALPAELRAQTVLVKGSAAEELIDRAGVLSLLVMGSRGYGPLRRALLGSVSAQVLRAAPCPVLVVPRVAVPVASAADAVS
jgi:nucleotide-binding universal stress UspA family protein